MPIPRFRMVRPGETLSAEQLNRQAEELTRLGSLSGCTTGGAVEVGEGGYGLALRLDLPRVFPARITDEISGAYGFVEQESLPDGTFRDKADGFSGTPTVNPAYELNEFPGIPEDTLVWMHQGHPYGAVEHFLFEYIPELARAAWFRITGHEDFAYSAYEVEPTTPTDGNFPTESGDQFRDKVSRILNGNLYERNRFPNVPIGSYVLATPIDNGRWWVFDYDYDHFRAEVTEELGDGEYEVIERDLLGEGIDNAREVEAVEFNRTEGITPGTSVLVWVLRIDGAISYAFEYGAGGLDDGAGGGVTVVTVNVTNIYDYTGVPGNFYFNDFNDILYLYIEGYGFYAICCPTNSGTGSGGVGSGGAGGDAVTSCCPAGLPRTLYAHITSTSGCACLNGLTVTLTWNGSVWASAGSSVCSGGSTTFYLSCPGGSSCTNLLFYATGHCNLLVSSPSSCDCATPTFTVSNSVAGCCSGTVSTIINETP